MPPWHADPSHGQFLNDRSLKAADRDALLKWANSGAPEGNPADLPKLPAFTEGWQMGQPDAIFTMQEDYPVPAGGTIDYKFFEVPTNLTEDKWVQAVEVRPGARAVVHHVIVYMRGEQTEPRQRRAGRARGRAPDAAVLVRTRHAASHRRAEAGQGAGRERSRAKARSRRVAHRIRARAIGSHLSAGHGAEDAEGRGPDRGDALHGQRQGDDRSHAHRREVRLRAAEDRSPRRAAADRELRAQGGEHRHARRRRDDDEHRRDAVERACRTRTCAARSGKSPRSIRTAARN